MSTSPDPEHRGRHVVFTTAVLSLSSYLGPYQILSCLSYLSRLVIYLWPVSLSSCVPSALLSGDGLKHCCLCNSRSVARRIHTLHLTLGFYIDSFYYWTLYKRSRFLHQIAFMGMIKALKMKRGLLWFILNIDDNMLLSGIPLLSILYLTLLFYCKPFDPDQINELWFDPLTICDKNLKGFLFFVVIFNYRELYSTWQCNI